MSDEQERDDNAAADPGGPDGGADPGDPAAGAAHDHDHSTPIGEDEIRLANEGKALDSIYGLAVYTECGGPAPRDQGCGKEHYLLTPAAVAGAMHGQVIVIRCKACGEVLRLVPPPQADEQMVKPVAMDMMRQIVAGGNGGVR